MKKLIMCLIAKEYANSIEKIYCKIIQAENQSETMNDIENFQRETHFLNSRDMPATSKNNALTTLM